MRCNIAPYFPLPGLLPKQAVAETVFEFCGRRFILRRLYDNMLFRISGFDGPEHTLFLTGKLFEGQTGANYPETAFAEAIRTRQYGRLVLYVCPQARDCQVTLFFRQDGTGFFQEGPGFYSPKGVDTVPFQWEARTAGLSALREVVEVDQKALLPLCERVFVGQVWPRMKDPYMAVADQPEEPLTFLSGSQRSLERLTRLIAYTEPTLFAGDSAAAVLRIQYIADYTRQKGGWKSDGCANLRLAELFRLAYRHNRFTGATWKFHPYGSSTRKKAYHLEPILITVTVPPPSAHERAEALLDLVDWLQDKVPENKLSALLGVER